MRVLGIALVIVGLAGLIYGGVSWTRKDKVVDMGPLEITADKRESLPMPPLVGGVVLLAGIALLMKKPS
jgi:hypothetical protein